MTGSDTFSWDDLWQGAERRLLDPREMLFHRGAEPSKLFYLESGGLRLIRPGRDGADITIQSIHPGETFAEASVFSEAYHCDGVATVASVVLATPRQVFLECLRSDPAFALAFTQRLARQLQQARTRCEIRGIRSADERVMTALRVLESEQGVATIPGTWMQWASEIGLTHEALYRVLSRLQKQGRLARDGRSVRLFPTDRIAT
ncbi:Crp/Fnr family transcriptional regulator [Magnetospira sp. QH-2]|uniref:Crp/Fnr family transcriptional regulator n=1 Tax=Magnetospira sp. (strain QH-2) TaxID=1288970 RepID=UPI0003E80C73|nr:Crp/Fnr family transcriptional regulator [Magnetospira sp. QH-2]CCQ75414.1 conserved protein of unknown function[Include Cyclic nucleotide-binding domain] [Magnetospira sp. QH-2]